MFAFCIVTEFMLIASLWQAVSRPCQDRSLKSEIVRIRARGSLEVQQAQIRSILKQDIQQCNRLFVALLAMGIPAAL